MPLIAGFEYGYAQGQDSMWCIRRIGQARMLCGKHAGFVPVVQPEHPQQVHDACLAAMYRTPGRVKSGVCPACEGVVPVVGGRVEPHGVFVQRGADVVESGDPCTGVNMAPRRGRA